MPFGLTEETIQKVHEVLRNHPEVESAILYGSRAKGNYRPGSDIDLTLCGKETLDLSALQKIMDEIDELLLPYTFDLSVYRSIRDDSLIEHIKRVGKIFYKK